MGEPRVMIVRPLLGRTPSRKVLVHALRGPTTLCGRSARGWDQIAAEVTCKFCRMSLARGAGA